MADIRPDRLTTCQSERKSVVSRRPSLLPVVTVSIVTLDPVLRDVSRSRRQGAMFYRKYTIPWPQHS
jgi:hypothetical protein